MRVKAYLDNGVYELYDENGMLVIKLKTKRQVGVFCKRNGYVLSEIFEIVKTECL
jgi:hypothetical protein